MNAGWEERDGRNICRWIIFWDEMSDGSIAGALGGYSGGGSFQMEQFFARCSEGKLANLMIYMEDKVTGDEIDFFDDVPNAFLSVCDDAQDVIMEWHDEDEWEETEQLVLLDDKFEGLFKDEDLFLLKDGNSNFIIAILKLAGMTAAPSN